MPFRYNPITGELDLVDTTTLPDDALEQIDTDSGNAIPVNHIAKILGTPTQGVDTSAIGNTVTITNKDATEIQKGVVELATNAEAIAGTDSSNKSIILDVPEASGINVYSTMAKHGLYLKANYEDIIYKIMIVGINKELIQVKLND